MKKLALFAALTVLWTTDAMACGPDIFAVPVASKPYSSKKPFLPKVSRSLWHAGDYLVSVEQAAACDATEIVGVRYRLIGEDLYLSWNWRSPAATSPSKQCIRRVDVVLYSLPPGEYRVKWGQKPDMIANCS